MLYGDYRLRVSRLYPILSRRWAALIQSNKRKVERDRRNIGSLADIANTHMALTESAHGGIENFISPSHMMGSAGFVEANWYGACYSVAFSDVDAYVAAAFYVENGGSFKVLIIHTSQGDNDGKTAGGVITVNHDVESGVESWDLNEDADLPLGDTSVEMFYTHATAVTISDDSKVGVNWNKDDNAGGAASNMKIYQIVLVRQ